MDSVFKILQDLNFTLRLDKSVFFQSKVKFLGFELSTKDRDKLDMIDNFEPPRNRKQLQYFLDLCNYYRQFEVKYSNYVEPFRELLSSKTKSWSWTEKHSEAYNQLKNNFVNSVTLNHVNNNLPFYLQTDASDNGISGILYQIESKSFYNIANS